MRCAVAASPEAVSESAICLCPAAIPTPRAPTASPSQPKNAFFQLSALQRPARAARLTELTAYTPLLRLPQTCDLRNRKPDYSNSKHEFQFKHSRPLFSVRHHPRPCPPNRLRGPECPP